MISQARRLSHNVFLQRVARAKAHKGLTRNCFEHDRAILNREAALSGCDNDQTVGAEGTLLQMAEVSPRGCNSQISGAARNRFHDGVTRSLLKIDINIAMLA